MSLNPFFPRPQICFLRHGQLPTAVCYSPARPLYFIPVLGAPRGRKRSLLAPRQRRRASAKRLSGFQKSPAKYQPSPSYIARKRMTEQDPWLDWIEPPLRMRRTRRGRGKNHGKTCWQIHAVNLRGVTSVGKQTGPNKEGYADVTVFEHELACVRFAWMK